jgi:hypothetical protein
VKRLAKLGVGASLGFFFAALTLALFVHRPPECGEPAACGDDYLFPAMPLALLLWTATFAYALVLLRKTDPSWRAFLLRIGLFTVLVLFGMATVFGISTRGA